MHREDCIARSPNPAYVGKWGSTEPLESTSPAFNKRLGSAKSHDGGPESICDLFLVPRRRYLIRCRSPVPLSCTCPLIPRETPQEVATARPNRRVSVQLR